MRPSSSVPGSVQSRQAEAALSLGSPRLISSGGDWHFQLPQYLNSPPLFSLSSPGERHFIKNAAFHYVGTLRAS